MSLIRLHYLKIESASSGYVKAANLAIAWFTHAVAIDVLSGGDVAIFYW